MMAESDSNNSPISQVLSSIGWTREDLLRHSDQMRQFLTAEEAHSLRVFATNHLHASSEPPSGETPLSRTSSKASVESESPKTPSKAPSTVPMPPSVRPFDSMEAVIERQSKKKRDKKGGRNKDTTRREENEVCVPPSPCPSQSGFSMDIFMESRDPRRVDGSVPSEPSRSSSPQDIVPFTPHQSKYYRDHVTSDTSSLRRHRRSTCSPREESPTPSHRRAELPSLDVPETPQHRAPYYRSPLPPSSPFLASSPLSSPTKAFINVVSSPGLMGPPPDEDDETLPYVLPPGPYSPSKPDLSYAALVGQAILSSPDHRLTLQEIYDWITIVYPHFKRGETTWMNSIRHVLSTTICFRKVIRERAVGRTLWAIWDEDLDCFKGGGFDKYLCKDMVEQGKVGKSGVRKRPTNGETSSAEKKPKRLKKTKSLGTAQQPYILPSLPTSYSLPLFPPSRPSAHHQSYYESCISQPPPTDIIFPPLPPSLSYHQNGSANTSSSASASTSTSHISNAISTSPPPSSATSSYSIPVPGLTPNRSSSSPPLPSDDYSAPSGFSHVVVAIPSDSELDERGNRVSRDTDLDAHTDADSMSMEALEPSFTLMHHSKKTGKSKKKRRKATPKKKEHTPPPIPVSPTNNQKHKLPSELPSLSPSGATRLFTPPPRPSTPPQNNLLRLSPHRTPLSHRGLHMSPSPSLAHYKSHLDPPPAVSLPVPGTLLNREMPEDGPSTSLAADNMRTPSRKRPTTAGGSALFPVTPKRLVFPMSGESPFRTPGSRSHMIYDPHDPGALLDEELSRLGERGVQGSPMGLFGRSGPLLYESPNVGSPGKWTKWW